MSKVTGFFATIILLVGISPLWAETTGQITVTGEGSVFAMPDMAVITMGASAEAETAKEAMDQTSEITTAILDRLTEAGVAEQDIQTSDLSLSPLWSNRSSSENRPRIDGYQASNRVTVRVRDLESLGPVLDAVLTDGANELGGLQFTLSDPEPLMNDARIKAVADARARAELLAEAAGVELGALISLSETGARAPRPEMLSMARASDSVVPVAQGEAELRASVTLVYEIVSP
jgi:uncharacterized protein YggE